MNLTDAKLRGRLLAGTALAAGILGAILRSVFFRTAMDAEGFLSPFHPMQILYWALAALVLLAAGLGMLKIPKMEQKAPMGFLPGVGQTIMGLCLAAALMNAQAGPVMKVLGWAAAVCLVADGVCRILGKPLGFFANFLFSAFLIVYLIRNYTVWSRIPQMELFLTNVLALFCLTLFSYHMAAWDQNRRLSPRLLFFGTLLGFFGLSSFGCPDRMLLCIGGGIWSLLTLAGIQCKEAA